MSGQLSVLLLLLAAASTAYAARSSQAEARNKLLKKQCRELLGCEPKGYLSSHIENPAKCKWKPFNDQWDWSCLCTVASAPGSDCEARCDKLCAQEWPGAIGQLEERTTVRATCGKSTHSCVCRALQPSRTNFFSRRPGFFDKNRRKRLAALDDWFHYN